MAKQAKKPVKDDPTDASARPDPAPAAPDAPVSEPAAPGATDGQTPGGTQASEAAGAPDAPDPDLAGLLERLQAAEARADENWERLVRTRAEMDNLRKRAERDVENAHKYALEGFVAELLAVRDSLEMGLAAAAAGDADVTGIREGTELTLKMLVQVMDKFNVSAVDPLGQRFDPELHQAMNMVDSADAEPNTVLAVIQKGYTLNQRLMRPALVSVAK